MTTRASLMGVFAAHALLLAFTLKLRAASVLRQMEGKDALGRLQVQDFNFCRIRTGIT
jgi:hypothetical protein